MADPFNRTYNPAKVQLGSDYADAYICSFRRAYLQLKKGMFTCEATNI